jgi:hypothetical protein
MRRIYMYVCIYMYIYIYILYCKTSSDNFNFCRILQCGRRGEIYSALFLAISNSGHLIETLNRQERRENVWIPCPVAPSGILVPDSVWRKKRIYFLSTKETCKHFAALNHLMSKCKKISLQSAFISSKNVMNALCFRALFPRRILLRVVVKYP